MGDTMSETIVVNKYKEKPSFIYAGFFIRLVAFAIDMLVVTSIDRILQGLVNYDYELINDLTGPSLVHWILILAYFTLLTYFNNGQTLGKMLMDIKVVSLDGNKLSLFQVVSRETFGRYVQNKYMVLYLIVGFAPMKQSLMDMLSDTAVIKNKEYSYIIEEDEIL